VGSTLAFLLATQSFGKVLFPAVLVVAMVIFTIEDTTLELAALAGEIMAGMDRFGRLSQTFDTDRRTGASATILDSTGNLDGPERTSRSTPWGTIPAGCGRFRGNQSSCWSDGAVR